MKGCINSINPMAMDCGPGIRVLVDIEKKEDGIELTPNEMVDRIRKFRPYFGPENGGVTFTGKDLNEYIEFVIETCHICHKAGITTCIETEGLLTCDTSRLLHDLDLVLLNINSIPMYNYNNYDIDTLMNISKFIDEININKKEVWVRQEINNKNGNEKYIEELKRYLNRIDNIGNIELIPNGVDSDTINKLKELL